MTDTENKEAIERMTAAMKQDFTGLISTVHDAYRKFYSKVQTYQGRNKSLYIEKFIETAAVHLKELKNYKAKL